MSPVTMPPTMPAMSPAMMGAPDASAMPSDSGMATRKTTSDASTSWRTDENNRGRVAWGEASGAMVGMDMATLHYGGPVRTRHDGTDRIDVMIR